MICNLYSSIVKYPCHVAHKSSDVNHVDMEIQKLMVKSIFFKKTKSRIIIELDTTNLY